MPKKIITETNEKLDTKALLNALAAMKKGDFTVRLPETWEGVAGKIADATNEIAETGQRLVKEVEKVGKEVGKEGKLTGRAAVGALPGGWGRQLELLNGLIEDLSKPTLEIGRVITAVAKGDLTQEMPLAVEGTPVKGEFLRLAKTMNDMVTQLSTFSGEVTRVAREVGTEGRLGGQAAVRGVTGTWKELTDNVNGMANNLTAQVRNIAEVSTAVAQGDLTKKITVEVRGEILELKNTINTMVDP